MNTASLGRELESMLAGSLALQSHEIDRELATANGTWKGAPAQIVTRAYTGARVRWCRAAYITGEGVSIANVLCVPSAALAAHGAPLPILGVDLVALGARESIVVADLSPMTASRPANDPLASALCDERYATLPRLTELPAWARETFSTHALAVRVSDARFECAADAVRTVARTFVELAGVATCTNAAVSATREAHHRYAVRHRDEDTGLLLLARIFGDEWSRHYIRTVLFPDLEDNT